MKLPCEVPVMTLPNVTLFPQALLPLYIFEPRYRRMLADALDADRMFCVAMQKSRGAREMPSSVAGLGLIRVSVGHRDGTSHLILQGLARVELRETVRYKPYRIQRIRPLEPPPCDSVAVDALVAKVRELLAERITMGMPFPFPTLASSESVPASSAAPASPAAKDILKCLDALANPEHVADLVSCAVLARATERQTILETVDLEARLKRLIYFLLAENQRQEENGGP